MRLRTYFFTGLLILFPLLVTAYIFWMVFSMIERFVSPLIAIVLGHSIPGLGFLLSIFLIVLIGLVGRNVIGRKLISFGEGILFKIPLVRTIYTTIKQIAEAIFTTNNYVFNRVVMLEYPRPGLYQLGFVTRGVSQELSIKSNKQLINVFVPTTPNPTSGMLVLVPEEELISLQMTVEEGLKLIVSGGTLEPPFKAPERSQRGG